MYTKLADLLFDIPQTKMKTDMMKLLAERVPKLTEENHRAIYLLIFHYNRMIEDDKTDKIPYSGEVVDEDGTTSDVRFYVQNLPSRLIHVLCRFVNEIEDAVENERGEEDVSEDVSER